MSEKKWLTAEGDIVTLLTDKAHYLLISITILPLNSRLLFLA